MLRVAPGHHLGYNSERNSQELFGGEETAMMCSGAEGSSRTRKVDSTGTSRRRVSHARLGVFLGLVAVMGCTTTEYWADLSYPEEGEYFYNDNQVVQVSEGESTILQTQIVENSGFLQLAFNIANTSGEPILFEPNNVTIEVGYTHDGSNGTVTLRGTDQIGEYARRVAQFAVETGTAAGRPFNYIAGESAASA
ncbi:MAG: hypothetical protein ACOCWX_05245, partial [Spirochaetota bacterium]